MEELFLPHSPNPLFLPQLFPALPNAEMTAPPTIDTPRDNWSQLSEMRIPSSVITQVSVSVCICICVCIIFNNYFLLSFYSYMFKVMC